MDVNLGGAGVAIACREWASESSSCERARKLRSMSNQVAKVRRNTIVACMTCPLCNKLFREATTISECLHTCEHSSLSIRVNFFSDFSAFASSFTLRPDAGASGLCVTGERYGYFVIWRVQQKFCFLCYFF